MNIVQYIRESCEIQNATEPEDYIGMSLAYEYALNKMWLEKGITLERSKFIWINDLFTLIYLIHGKREMANFRSQPAIFANGRQALSPQRIPAQVNMLLEQQANIPVNEFYWIFEEIHPWQDGNGRVGSLLWNVLNNSILDPLHPPGHPAWSR